MKYALPAAVVLFVSVGLVLVRSRAGGIEPDLAAAPLDYSWSEMRAIYREERRLDAEGEVLHRFTEALRQAKDDVLTGALSLEEAAALVHREAESSYPRFLTFLARQYPDSPTAEHCRRLLFDHFKWTAQSGRLTRDEAILVSRLRDRYECNERPRRPRE